MQRGSQFLHGIAVLVVRTGDQDVHVRRVAALDHQGVLGRVQLGFQRVVGVDQRQVDLGQHARQGRGFQLTHLDALGVVGNVLWRGSDAGAILEADHAGLGQQQQGAAAVGGVVGDDHVGAIGQRIQRLVLAGISTEGLDMHAGYADQIGALALVEFIQVRLMLEEVGVQALLGDLDVRLHVVGEDLHVQRYALLGQLRFDELQQLRVRHGGGSHVQGFGLRGKCGNGGQGDNQFLHRSVPS